MKIVGDRITTKEMFELYKEKHPDSSIKTYKQFKAVIVAITTGAVQGCLEGGVFHFGSHVGDLRIVQVTKKFKLNENGEVINLKVNWGETNKLRRAGNTTDIIYHTDSVYYHWHWFKFGSGAIKNKDSWKFLPTQGPLGISRMIPAYLKENKRAHLNYHKIFKPQ